MKLLALAFLSFTLTAQASTISRQDRVSCRMPADQGMGSLQGSWEQLPLKIAFDADFYKNGGAEAKQLKKAVATWNKWAALKGKVAFVIQNEGKGVEIPSIEECAQAAYTSAMPNVVGVWKIAKEGAHKNRRFSCPVDNFALPGKLLPDGSQGQTDWMTLGGKLQAASVLLNFDQFNSPGGIPLDIESQLLHELGHVLGMLHSCNGSYEDSVDSTSAPACVTAPKEYTEAVMFPFLDAKEKRRKLTQNDFDRVNCLY